jgi:hypothetical protein
MLPQGYEPVALAVLLLAGVLACFAGERLLRVVLGIYGFIAGAMVSSSVVGVSNTTGMLMAAVVGGFLGAVVLVFAWFVGVSLVGAGLAVAAAHLVWSQVGRGDPPAVAIIVVAVAGAVGALFIQKYVVVTATAFLGAWTIVIAAVNAMPQRALARGSSDTEVWILYPTSTPASRWVPIAWIALGLAGAAMQLSRTGKKRRR